jgi:hypothetical protein
MVMAIVAVAIPVIMMLPRSVRRIDRSAVKTDRTVHLFPDRREVWAVLPLHK